MSSGRRSFGLTLVVNHACNLRCTYCYTGAKVNNPMPARVGLAAIDRAFASSDPSGCLNLSFFGGEPLLESARILEWMSHARRVACQTGKCVRFNLTTNGTVNTTAAWEVMRTDDLDLAVSFDGLPETHDRHRSDVQGNASAARVEATLKQLLDWGKRVRINFVVRPDTLGLVPDGLVYLHDLGVREIDLSLDLWTEWTAADGVRLERMIHRAAELWRDWLPDFSLNWFDAKAGSLANMQSREADTRCGFGEGEIAVAPSGRLYPCERLVGEDHPDNPMRLPGTVLNYIDFSNLRAETFQASGVCSLCALQSACDSHCRCSNYIRTGDVNRPDGLLCILNKATADAVSTVLQHAEAVASTAECHQPKTCYG